MKKFVLLLCAFVALLSVPQSAVFADDNENYEEQLSSTVEEQLGSIDFDKLDKLLADLAEDYTIFGNTSFRDRVADILSGNYFNDYPSLFSAMGNLLLGQVKQFLPVLLIILCISILGSIITNFRPNLSSKGVNDIVHFVCYGLVIILVAVTIKQVCTLTSRSLNSMTGQMQAIFPILMTLLTAIGSVASVSIYNPVVAVLTNGVTMLFSKVMFPMFMLAFIFVILGHLTSTAKLKKLTSFVTSSFKWLVGIIFTVFGGLLTIQGISAGKADGLSIKLTKFTVKSYIPIIGGYISEGFDLIVLSSMLIKNAIGLVGLFVILGTILVPIITIVVLKLGLKLAGGLTEPIGDGKISNFLDECSNLMIYPIVIILAVAFMYLITISLIISTANVL